MIFFSHYENNSKIILQFQIIFTIIFIEQLGDNYDYNVEQNDEYQLPLQEEEYNPYLHQDPNNQMDDMGINMNEDENNNEYNEEQMNEGVEEGGDEMGEDMYGDNQDNEFDENNNDYEIKELDL